MKKIIAFLTALIYFNIQLSAQGVDKPKYRIDTYRLQNFLGSIEIELFPLIAPLHTQNFDTLVAQQFYDSTAFHRVVPGFVIQGGDPNSISGPINTWGQGQPWQQNVPAEFNVVRHLKGIIGAARDTNINSANSQFYICVGSPTYLDGNYTVFGRVTSGLNIVDSIALSPRDPNDVPFQKISMFVTAIGTNPSVPLSPQLNTPADNAVSVVNTQTFSWSAVDSAVMYTIEFSNDSLFNNIAFSKNVALPQTTFPNMNGLTDYFWRVKANNGGHESAYSQVRRFNSTTGAANGIYPIMASTGLPINLNFIWSSVQGATSYILQVSTSPTFTTASMIYNQGGLIDTIQTVTGLLTNKVYYWRVQSENNGLPGMFSAKYYFTTGTSTGINETSSEAIILNSPYPNPTKEFCNLQIKSKANENVSLYILTTEGKIVQEQEIIGNGKIMDLTIDTSYLEAGLYLLQIAADNRKETCKLLIR
jgi:peptidyl-prolyl cis-trans isomerase B (cyclophilin B)